MRPHLVGAASGRRPKGDRGREDTFHVEVAAMTGFGQELLTLLAAAVGGGFISTLLTQAGERPVKRAAYNVSASVMSKR